MSAILKSSVLLAFLFLFSHCAGTRTPPCPCSETKGVPSVSDSLQQDSLLFVDNACGFKFRLPHIKGWVAGRPLPGMSRAIVFAGVHLGRLVNVVLSVEPLNGEIEDYLYLIHKANRFEEREGYRFVSLDTLREGNEKSVRFVYRAEVVQDGSGEEGDSTLTDGGVSPDDSLAVDSLPSARTTAYVFTNYIRSYGECNLWLEISTPEEAYERKKSFLKEIYQGLVSLDDNAIRKEK